MMTPGLLHFLSQIPMSEISLLPEQGISTQHAGAVAAAQHAVAQIQARATIALARPRDIDLFRTRMMKDCSRPGFADKAYYEVKNRGKGLSIRFAESVLRNYGNLYTEAIVVDDNPQVIVIRVSVTDLETNACMTKDVPVEKTMERKYKPADESIILGQRLNSRGEDLYILRATSEESLGKVNANISKAMRTLILKFVPFDIVEECEKKIKQTNRQRDKEDPDAAKHRLVDSFATVGVTPADLAGFLGKSLQRLQPADLEELRGIWGSLVNGDISWEAILEEKHPTQVAEGVTNAMDAEAPPYDGQAGGIGGTKGPGLGDLAGELDKAEAKPKRKPKAKPEPEPMANEIAELASRTRGDILTDIESLGRSEAQLTSAASDMTGETVLDYMKLTDDQLADLFNRLNSDG